MEYGFKRKTKAGGKNSEQNTAKNETGSTEPKLPNHFPFKKKQHRQLDEKRHEIAGYAFIG